MLVDKAIDVVPDSINKSIFFMSIDDRINSRLEDKEDCIPTNLGNLDRFLFGGIRRKELGVVMAPPSRGKTISLIHLGVMAIQNNYKDNHYTLEMSEERVEDSYDSRLSGVHAKELK